MNANHHHPFRTLFLALGTTLMLTLTSLTGGAAQPDPDTNLLAVHYIDQILERGNTELAASLVAPDALLLTPEGAYTGPEGVAAYADHLAVSFSDLDFDVVEFVSVNDTLVIQYTMSGVQTGTYQGIPGKCADFSVPAVATLSVTNGSIGEQRITYDQAGLIQQVARFNMFADFEGHTCATLSAPLSAPIQAAPSAPTCLKVATCELPG